MTACPKCGFDLPAGAVECGRCGIVLEKFLSRRRFVGANQGRDGEAASTPEETGSEETLKELFFHVENDVNLFYFAGRVVVFLGLFFWGWKFILSPVSSNYAGNSLMHLVNLPFHEAGHIIFRPLGNFMAVLGGSLLQVIVPLICLVAFLLKTRDPFAASVAFWWTGESLMDLAPYINDARELKLMLLGGVTGRDVAGYHDWEQILRTLGCLKYDHLLAVIVNVTGIIIILGSFVWGGTMLYRQFRRIGLS
jgi:hypothetical protein